MSDEFRVGTPVPKGYRYADHIPYDTPESLDDLQGPRLGLVRVPGHIDTSPTPVYDLEDPGDRWGLYSAVVRDGTVEDQLRYLDKDFLERLWPALNLPARCRDVWEQKFPELRALRDEAAD